MTLVASGSDGGTTALAGRPIPLRAVAAEPRPQVGAWVWAGRAQVLADLVAIVAAMVVAFPLAVLAGSDPVVVPGHHLALGILSLPVWGLAFARRGLYVQSHVARRADELRHLVEATLVSLAVVVGGGYLVGLPVDRAWSLLWAATAVTLASVGRETLRHVCARLRADGRLLRPVLVVGAGAEGLALCSMLSDQPSLGYRIVGFVDDGIDVGATRMGRPVVGRVEDTLAAARQLGVAGVLVSTTGVDVDASNRLTRELTDAGLQVVLSSSLRDISATRLVVRSLGRHPVVHVEPVRREGWRARAKRVFDLAGAVAVAVVVLPLLVVVALAVKLGSPGPVLFRQQRIGKDGELFELVKFRTMVVGAEALVVDLSDRNEADGPLFKLRDDPRCTRVGRLIRALSIDELPQLWNVVRGEMSLVGPRPALAREAEQWPPSLRHRLAVKPGMTGMWQVSGRSSARFEDYARLDLYYVDNWSLWTDLAILARTVPAVVLRRGAH